MSESPGYAGSIVSHVTSEKRIARTTVRILEGGPLLSPDTQSKIQASGGQLLQSLVKHIFLAPTGALEEGILCVCVSGILFK